MQRFRLSEEFQCQLYVRQLETKFQENGMTVDSFVAHARRTLEDMQKQAEQE